MSLALWVRKSEVIVGLFHRGHGQPPVHLAPEARRADYHARARVLAELGIRLRDPRQLDAIMAGEDPRWYDRDPWESLVFAFGRDSDDAKGDDPYSDDVMWLDYECVDDAETYQELILRWAGMTHGELPVSSVHCTADEQAGTIAVHLCLRGSGHEATFRLDGDWLDGTVLTWLNRLLAEHGSAHQFFLFDSEGQDGVLLFSDEATVAELIAKTGLMFHPA